MSKTYNNKELSMPFDEILLKNGYDIKKEKSTRNSITMSNNIDTIVITRLSNGHYLYFNPNDTNDRGNIYSFCKNRGLKLKDLLNNKVDIKELKHNLTDTKEINNDNKVLEDFKTLKALDEDSYFVSKRLIDKEILNDFSSLIKQDKFHNICIPTYTIKKIKDVEILTQSGYMTYLKTPMKKDKDGVVLKKAIKQICYGKKGLELLKTTTSKMNDIKNIIISESIIDSLSLLELKNLNPNESLLCSTNGTYTNSHKESLNYLKNNIKNANFILGFDNDERGLSFSKSIKETIKEKITDLKPILKDFNDDLLVSKFLRLNKNFSIDELENSLKNNFILKINKYKKLSKHKELKFSQKILKLIEPKIQNYISKDSLKALVLAQITKGNSLER